MKSSCLDLEKKEKKKKEYWFDRGRFQGIIMIESKTFLIPLNFGHLMRDQKGFGVRHNGSAMSFQMTRVILKEIESTIRGSQV